MAEYTKNFNLTKPLGSDPADITKLNANWDTIDGQLAISNTPFVANSTDGVNYTVTIDGINALYNGLTITVIPNMSSTSTNIKLDLNGLGAKNVRLTLPFTSGNSGALATHDAWFSADAPMTLRYHEKMNMWKSDLQRQSAQALYGSVPITSGGTGAEDAATARENLGITPENIGAATANHTHSASEIGVASHTHSVGDIAGVLPISKGGTGVTDVNGIKTNLGFLSVKVQNIYNNTNIFYPSDGAVTVSIPSYPSNKKFADIFGISVLCSNIDGVGGVLNGFKYYYCSDQSQTTPYIEISGVDFSGNMFQGQVVLNADYTLKIWIARFNVGTGKTTNFFTDDGGWLNGITVYFA